MSKCDFRIDFSSRTTPLPKDLLSKMRFSVDPPLGPSADFTSSKCDWRMNVGSVQADGVRDRLSALKANLRDGSLLRVISDKCDWSIRVTPASTELQPAVGARMASDKCDFAATVHVGIENRTNFRFAAASSSKCDLKAGPLQVFDPDSKTWKPVDGGDTQGGS